MIDKCYFLRTNNHDPYHNQALQEYFLTHIPDNSIILFLYSNDETIQLANNSCVLKDTNFETVRKQKINVSRSLCKGETIYQDRNCLNFAFFCYKNNYNVVKNTKVILDTLRGYGMPANFDMQSQIMIDSHIVATSQYYVLEDACMHQGTIYFDVNNEKRAQYLSFDNYVIKTAHHQLSRNIANLKNWRPDLTFENLQNQLLQNMANEFGNVYELKMPEDYLGLVDNFYSYEYIYLKQSTYTLIVHDVFSVGEMEIYLDVERNKVLNVDIYSQNISPEIINNIKVIFVSLYIDDVYYRQKLFKLADASLYDDLNRIYKMLKKYSF